jgi:glycosyltransferase involved in cell wall biosynthesis
MSSVDINGRFLTQTITGVQRYATQMVRAVDRHLASDESLRRRYQFRLVAPRQKAVTDLVPSHIPVVPAGRLHGQLWEQLELPKSASHRLILNLCNTAPLIAPRNIVTIHDASVYAIPEAYSYAFRSWYRLLIPTLGMRAVRIVTGSEFSRGELFRRAGVPATKIEVIPLGCEHILHDPADLGVFNRLPVQPQGYLLTVGSRSSHKNIEAVAQAASRLPAGKPPLVIAGGANPKVFRAPAGMNADNLHSAGYVTDAELRALYENAICLVFPSLYEGFGLPPLEAMACGCPAVVANAASLPEVCGDAVLYCDPRDPDDIARKITMTQDPRLREELRRRGIGRASCFTWTGAAGKLLTLLDSLQPL